ncbi:MAG: hypothetical protein AAF705_06400 [Bacteroidota bacterium]
MSGTYSVADLIGLTLYAKKPVPIRRSAFDSAPVVFTVEPGQPIGVLDSWITASADRATLYFQYKDQYGRFFYTPYLEGHYKRDVVDAQIKKREEKEQQKNKKPW